MLLFLNQFPVSVFVSSYETFFHVYLRRVSSSTSFVVEFVNNFWWNVLRLRTFSFTWLSFGAGDRSLSDDFLARRQMAFNSPLCLAHKSAFLPWQFQLPQSRPWRSDHASWTQIAAEPEKNRHCVSFNCHLQFTSSSATSSRCCCCLNSFQNDFINNHESAQQKIIELDRIRSEQRWIKNQLIKWNKKKLKHRKWFSRFARELIELPVTVSINEFKMSPTTIRSVVFFCAFLVTNERDSFMKIVQMTLTRISQKKASAEKTHHRVDRFTFRFDVKATVQRAPTTSSFVVEAN